MTPPTRTRAILEALTDGDAEELTPRVLKLFGAQSLEECAATYETIGAAERSSLDGAIQRVAADAGAAFLAKVEAQVEAMQRAYVPNADPAEPAPYADLAAMIEADAAEAEGRSQHGMESFRIVRVLLSPGRSYAVEDDAGARKFHVSGSIGFARKFSIKDAQKNVRYSVREKLLALEAKFIISRDGTAAAVVRRTMGSRGDTFEIALQSGELLRASGELWTDDGVQIERDNRRIATIRREQNMIREIFRLTVLPTADQALLLAIGMSIVETDSSRGNASA